MNVTNKSTQSYSTYAVPSPTPSPTPHPTTLSPGHRGTRRGTLLVISTLFLILVAVGCTATQPAGTIPGQSIPFAEGRIDTNLSNFTIPGPILSTSDPVTATVVTGDQRANVRSGPGINFLAVAAAASGTEFQIVATNEEEDWWQICCIVGEGDEAEEPSTLAWLADVVVSIDGETDDVPVLRPIFDDELEAEWNVEWACGSERCEVQECSASVSAIVDDVISEQWLQLDHTVLWDDTCFSTDEWLFEVNTVTGIERTSSSDDSFLYRYWVGVEPGEVNAIFNMDDGSQVAAWCSGPHELEVEVGDGWTTVYTGNTCHDVQTGILLSLTYEKRWLYSGEFEGTTYEQEYFGDFEILDQYLVSTSAVLAYLDEN